MPILRPFRALRYDPDAVGDLAAVVSPPYDVISPDEQRRLLERHPRNVVRLDLPPEEPGDAPDDRYRRAARTFAEWRSDGTLRKDPRPAIYAYEQRYRAPGQPRGADRPGLLRPAPARALRAGERRPAARADALGPEGGPLPPPAGDRGELQSHRRPLRGAERSRSGPPRRPRVDAA
ncbi:MAG: hypothetical protein KatS3mg065_0768 [Chloroflexota bacterium]|nr:MAG: hypothetical protein KatS3mg065_0768 [Chloroflexota bacterium]